MFKQIYIIQKKKQQKNKKKFLYFNRVLGYLN